MPEQWYQIMPRKQMLYIFRIGLKENFDEMRWVRIIAPDLMTAREILEEKYPDWRFFHFSDYNLPGTLPKELEDFLWPDGFPWPDDYPDHLK
jgi:hypothetical protein